MVKTIEFLVKYGYTDASLQERRQKCLVLQQRSMFQAGPAHIADTILKEIRKENAMKKVIALVLALLMLCTVFAGCSKQNDTPAPSQTNEPASSNTSSDTPASDSAETLTVWCWDENFNIAAMHTAEKYYKEAGHENFSLNILNVIEEDVQTKLSTVLSSGATDELPDIVLMGDSWANMYLTNFPGCYVDLTDEIDFSEFAQYKVSCFSVDDRVYGIPFDSGSAGLFYRTDILEEAGYTAEDLEDITWWDLVEIGKTIHEKTGKYALSFDPSNGCAFTYMDSMMQASGEWFYDVNDPDENADFANNKVVREMSEVLKAFWTNDLVYRTDTRDSSSIGAVQAGEVAFVPNAIWYAPSLMASEESSGKWSYTNMPTLTTVETSKYTNIGGSSWVILENSSNKALAIDFMKTIWAGNKDFYDEILLGQAAVSTWLPATNSEAYNTPIEFFGGKKLYADFASWGEYIPSIAYGTHTWTVNQSVSACLSDFFNDTVDIDGLMANLQATYDSMK